VNVHVGLLGDEALVYQVRAGAAIDHVVR
jgi:hypothetical protein